VVLAHDLVSALDTGNGSVRTFPADGSAALQAATDAAAAGTPLIPALSSKEAQDAARDLGYMHGVYGVEIGELPAIPGDLMGDYDAGRAEGETAKAGPVAAPVDRAAVFRRARAFLDSADGDGFSPDHLNDRFNLDKWGSQPAWATRNQGPKGVYVPGTADTRGDYASVNLMRTAMEWFEDSMTLNPDKKQADAAITYMAALLATISGEANVAKDDMRGEPVESGEGAPADEGGTDTSMPEYDADGNEINATPFYEDSYADPNAVHPLDARTRYSRAGRLGNRALFLANAARTADYYNGLILRVNEREGARVMAQRAALDRRALSAENRFNTTMGLLDTRLRDAQAKIPVTAASRMPALQKQVNGLSCAMTRCSAAHAALQATLSARADAISAGRSARAALIAITIQKYTAAAAAAQARADAAAAKKDDDAAKTADGLTGSGGTVAPPLVTAPDAAPVAGPGTVVVPPVKNDDLLNSGCGRGARFRGGPVCNRWWKPNPWGANARAAALAARRAKSAARKAAAKLKIKQDAVAAAAKSEEDWNNSVDAFRACNGDDPAPLLSTAVDAGFSVPDPASVYYHDGNWYDSAGAFIVAGSATASSGPVFRNGYWYDAKTGRTLGKRGKF